MPQNRLSAAAPAAVPGLRPSWIDSRTKSGALLYVSDQNASTVFIYAYPSLAPAGQLTGFNLPSGLCVNRRTGDVWVTDAFASTITEFAHGGTTPIRTISDGSVYAAACSVKPRTGDLAVTSFPTDDPSVLQIYKPESSKPTTYADFKHAFSMNFDTYDTSGNVFIDATHFGPGHFGLDELAKGSGVLTTIAWAGPQVRLPGGIQFDGIYLAIGDAIKDRIYRTSNGSVIATVNLKDACIVNGFLIHEGAVIALSACSNSTGQVLIYNYPAGGAPVKRLSGFNRPYSAVVSP